MNNLFEFYDGASMDARMARIKHFDSKCFVPDAVAISFEARFMKNSTAKVSRKANQYKWIR